MATIEESKTLPRDAQLPRDEMIALLQAQPADSTYEELMRQLAMARMMDRGIADLEAGRTLSHEEVGKRIASWRS